jgi:hypothetical protein
MIIGLLAAKAILGGQRVCENEQQQACANHLRLMYLNSCGFMSICGFNVFTVFP